MTNSTGDDQHTIADDGGRMMAGRGGTQRSTLAAFGAALLLLAVAPATSAATPPPPFFSVRLEGTALRVAAISQARNVNPAPAYSFANVTSIQDLDGGRGLQMKAVGTTNDPGDLGGVVVFAPDTPTRGASDFPNYSEAFFPAFEDVGQTTVAEKCALNNQPREEPACRDQPGPYALAQVVPEELAPEATGIGRTLGDDGNAETFSRSEIRVTDEGEIVGTQVNAGRDMTVPGTPIRVESFRTQSRVVSTPDGVEAAGSCEGTITVNGQTIDSNDELQALVAALAGTGLRVDYTPPTEAKVNETFGGTKEVSCVGPRFVVTDGSNTVEYTYGRTFATASPASDKPLFDAGGELGGVLGGFTPPSFDAGPLPDTAPAPLAPAPAPDAGGEQVDEARPPRSTGDEVATGPGLIEKRIDTLPLAAATTLAAVLFPLGVWLLIGVVGSLSRGYTTLHLPPFKD